MDYPVGTLVWVFRPTRKESESKNLRFAWSGPYRVAERKGNATYKVVWANETVPLTERQWPQLTVHAKNLHRAYWRPELNVKRVVALPPVPVAEMGAGGAEVPVELVGARGADLDGRASAAHLEQSAEGAKVVVEPVSENAPSVYVPVPEPEPLRTAVPEAPRPVVDTHAQSAAPGLEVEQGCTLGRRPSRRSPRSRRKDLWERASTIRPLGTLPFQSFQLWMRSSGPSFWGLLKTASRRRH